MKKRDFMDLDNPLLSWMMDYDAISTCLRVRPQREDVLVTLGDYVDRGPDSAGVIERLFELEQQTQWVPLLGNHDLLFKQVLDGDRTFFDGWLSVGGTETLDSYGGRIEVPASHRAFLENRCRLFYEPEGAEVFFVHGSVVPKRPLTRQRSEDLLWQRVTDLTERHESGKLMICGHTAQRSGLPLVTPNAICIDTWAFGEGWLTCFDVHAETFVQANEEGQVRAFSLADLVRGKVGG
jgi:serine/threonine protein phosphatase 1